MIDTSTLRAGIYGLLLGDAAGVPYEFKPPGELAPFADRIGMIPPPGFRRTYTVPPGTWSDDGALALCLLESLVDLSRFDPDDQARRTVARLDRGHLAVDAHVFDVGITTREALGRARALLGAGRSPVGHGASHEQSAGNGTLMRILPLALWHVGSDADLAARAILHSGLTHAHPACLVSCILYCLWARGLASGLGDPFGAALAGVGPLLGDDPPLLAALDLIEAWGARAPTGTGFVIDTLHSARQALDRGDEFKDVIRRAILLGHDTDTTAAVAGGLAGIKYGLGGLPEDWMDLLRGREMVEAILGRAIA